MSNLVLDTFECPKKFKTIGYITEKMNLMDVKHRKKLAILITTFNKRCLSLEDISDLIFFNYSMRLVKEDYRNKIQALENDYEKVLISYLRNFIFTKLKLIKYVNTYEFAVTMEMIKNDAYKSNISSDKIYAQLLKYGYVVTIGGNPALTHKGYSFLKRNI